MNSLTEEDPAKERDNIKQFIIIISISAMVLLTFVLSIMAFFSPEGFWNHWLFRTVPFFTAVIIGHIIGYAMVKFLLFRNKIKLNVGHFDFIVFFGAPLGLFFFWISALILNIIVPILVTIFNIPIGKPVPDDWNLFFIILVISLNAMPIKIMTFTMVYIIAGFAYSNPEKSGVFKYKLYLNPKEKVMKNYLKE